MIKIRDFDVITKPVDFNDLKQKIERLMLIQRPDGNDQKAICNSPTRSSHFSDQAKQRGLCPEACGRGASLIVALSRRNMPPSKICFARIPVCRQPDCILKRHLKTPLS